ncbi:MAG: redoxin domain-containing protein [Roseiflexaceae bacterium]
MDTYYTALEIPTTATVDEVEAAYQRQRARYSPERVAALGAEFRQIAEARTVALDQAYVVLSDAARRAEYDNQLNGAAPLRRRAPGAGLSRREVLMALGGAIVGLLVIGLVWVLSGRNAQPALPPVGELNRPAPDFTLPGLNGQDVRLSDYRGKVVLVNFWGTWCEPCKEETPALQQSYQKLRDQGLVIIGVDLRSQEGDGAEGVENVRSFTERYGVTYPIALDVKGEVARAFQIYPIPTSYFIDPSGTIRYVRPSTLTAEEVEVLFTKLRQATSALR